MVSNEAKEISQVFQTFKKLGGITFNYNSKRGYTSSQSGWVDHVIIWKRVMYLVEVKLGKDQLSEEQALLGKKVYDDLNYEVQYYIITSVDQAREFMNLVLELVEDGEDRDYINSAVQSQLFIYQNRTESFIREALERIDKKRKLVQEDKSNANNNRKQSNS